MCTAYHVVAFDNYVESHVAGVVSATALSLPRGVVNPPPPPPAYPLFELREHFVWQSKCSHGVADSQQTTLLPDGLVYVQLIVNKSTMS